MYRKIACIALVVLSGAVVGVVPSSAQVPGTNGRVVFVGTINATLATPIFSVRPDGTGLKRLTPKGSFDSDPDVSPSGQQVAFVRRTSTFGSGSILLMGIDGSSPTSVGPSDAYEPAWSPDGTKIAYSMGFGLLSEICLMGANGGSLGCLTDNAAEDSAPTWSPDGSMIAFTREAGAAGEKQIFVMKADGDAPIKITSGKVGHGTLDWAPDGSLIAFDRITGRASGAIGVVTPSGAGYTLLRDDDRSYNPTWSPDGSKIAFSREGRRGADIWTMGADGSNAVRVLERPGYDYRPDWQPRPAV